MLRKKTIKILFAILLIIFIYYSFWFFKFSKHYPDKIDLNAKKDYWGVTFSRKFCDEMNLNWRDVYLAMLDDLNVKYVRIPIYWDDIEKEQGVFDFKDYDYIFDEGAKRNIKFVANVGWRLPRWPECHAPKFMNGKEVGEYKERTMEIVKVVVDRYKNRPEIIYWQVENEPLLNTFGKCPDGDETFLRKEVALVKTLDKRPIIISASGELSSWIREGKIGDIFGTTMYRVVWSPWFGYFRYPIPDWFYKFKANIAGIDKSNIMISELQAEPWVPNGTLADLSFKEAKKSFDIDQFKANLQYAINADLNKSYLWGVEWWYHQRQIGNSQYWDLAKEIFK